VLCDAKDEKTGAPVDVAPRSILARQLERLAAAGFTAKMASELEFFLFDDDFRAARAKGYRELRTAGDYVEDYHILSGTFAEPVIGAIRRDADASAIPVEFSKGEWGPGQHEINLRYAEALEMADRHVLYKAAAKEIAAAQGKSLTFMAKWHERHAGSSCHVHMSLWNGEQAAFAQGREATPVFHHFLGGLLAHARELAWFFAPTVNSYKRYSEGTFAPTRITWSVDNRTAGFRIVGGGPSLRVECRIPGADANPYVAFAAIIAAGLDGIERKIEPPPMLSGNLYGNKDVSQIPRTLGDAIAAAESSPWVRAVLGDDVLDHYLFFARVEKSKFENTVTTWGRAGYFERI
jgi:glutamine synthetase